MIIQCEQCQTKFRLDDSKVKDSGIKVRCARCRHTFAVSKEQHENAQPSDSGAIFDQNAAFIDVARPFDPFASHDETTFTTSQPEYDFDSSSTDADEEKESTLTVDSTMFDLPEEEPLPVSEPEAQFGLYDPEADQEAVVSADEPPAQDSGIDFDGFDFGAVPEFDVSGAEESAPFPDLSGTPSDTAAPLDFQLSDFADSAPTPGTGEEGASSPALTFDEPFNLGEIDFGDDLSALTSQQVNPDDLKGGLDFDFGHLDEPQESTTTYAAGGGAPWVAPVQAVTAPEPQPSTELTSDKIGMWGPWSLAVPELPGSAVSEEVPPLSITSRRKQSHLVTFLLSTVAFFGMVIGIYTGNTRIQEESATVTPGQTGQAGQAAPAAGKITLNNVDAAFINNKKTGELLVITGTAVNNFETPRAAIQIKGMIYGQSDQIVASKTAYCGNTLTREQLASMPLETIEAAMANQFGSALDNLEVAPGKGIPCMVVISKLPEDSKNYGAVLAGSQPAAAKQKKAE